MCKKAANPPDWTKVMEDGNLAEDNGYITITKGTAKLAKSSLLNIMEQEYYHNYGAAYNELKSLLEDNK